MGALGLALSSGPVSHTPLFANRARAVQFSFARHPGAGRKRPSTAEWLVIQSLGVYLSRYGDLARLPRASDLLPEAGLLSLACPRDPTGLASRRSNQREGPPSEGPPDDAPSGLHPPGARVGCGVFRQGILPWRKTGRRPCRPPCGLFLHPPAASYEDPEGQEPDQEPNARRCGAEEVFCRSALVRDQPERCTAAPRSRTSALLQKGRHAGGSRTRRCAPLFVGAHLCATAA